MDFYKLSITNAVVLRYNKIAFYCDIIAKKHKQFALILSFQGFHLKEEVRQASGLTQNIKQF